MPRVFYSWQTDAKPNRGFIRGVLQKVVAQLAGDSSVDEPQRDIVIDQDTQGLPGSPPVADAILEKIRTADVFVADLTFIGGPNDTRKTPNPNVMLEYGYALHALGDARIIAVFNEAYGDPKDLPFDLAHRRWPIRFNLPEGNTTDRNEASKFLVASLGEALRSVVAQFGVQNSAAVPPLSSYDAAKPGDGIGRLRGPNDYLCVPRDGDPIFLASGAYAYFRLVPSQVPRPLGDVEAYEIAQRYLQPMSGARGGGGTTCRHHSGAVSYWSDKESPKTALEASELFLTGELWGNSHYLLAPQPDREKEVGFSYIPTGAFEECLIDTLINFSSIAREHLKFVPPVKLEMGIAGVGDYRLAVDPNYFNFSKFEGRILVNDIRYETILENWVADIFDLLEPFFASIYDRAGIRRPSVRAVGRRQR